MVQEGKVLTITNINRIDAGKYTCTAYNGFGKPENQTVNVTVTCEYALRKTLNNVKHRYIPYPRSPYFLCSNVYCQLLVLMLGKVHP